MRVLLIKTSSMGDVIHTLPALTDAQQAIAGIRFDWVVEEGFVDIPAWHPAVDQVIPVAIRRWRKQLWQTWRSGVYRDFKRRLQQQPYDLVLDAQCLLKSAWLTRGLSAPVAGLDRHSSRDPASSFFYGHRYAVDPQLHAVERVRSLFAQALGYPLPQSVGDYGLDRQQIARQVAEVPDTPYFMFLHGTTWPSKHWPEAFWRTLTEHCQAQGQPVLLPWGTAEEQQRAERLAADLPLITVLPRLRIAEVASYLAGAQACVAVDTGLGHLTAALDTPCISLYGPTRPQRVGAYGRGQVHLCATGPYAGQGDRQQPCFDSLGPEQVLDALAQLLSRQDSRQTAPAPASLLASR